MIKKVTSIRHLLDNKSLMLLGISIIALSIVVSRYIEHYKLSHSTIYRKLQGDYELNLDSSYVNRSFDIYPVYAIVMTMQVQHNQLSLPNFSSYTNEKMPLFGYSWKIISTNPDSIFIEAYPHVLHGKYKVMFTTSPEGPLGYGIANYLFLDNDSTHLCLKKINRSHDIEKW